MKVCFKCGAEKPLTEFYKHKMMGDGHLNKCKECTKADSRARYYSEDEAVKEYERKRAMLPHRVEGRKRYRATDQGKASVARAHKKYREREPLRNLARYALNNAIRDKVVTKPTSCVLCGKGGRIEGHHTDYYKPLEVMWLCNPCHRKQHQE